MSLRTKRESVGLTQDAVANELSIARSTVAMWETGKSFPRPKKLHLLAALYHCTIDELLREYPDNESITHGEAV